MKRKSLWMVLTVLLLVLAMAACNPDQPDNPDNTETTTNAESTGESSTEQPSDDQTTQETTTEPTTDQPPAVDEQAGYVISFGSATIGNIASQDMDKMELSFDAEQQAMKVEVLAAGRPNFILSYPDIPEVSEYPYVAVRLKTSSLESTGVFFMASSGSGYDILKDGVYTDKTLVYSFTEDWQTVVLDYTRPNDGIEDGADSMYNGNSAYIRFDPWYSIDAGAVMYINSIAFFKTEAAAAAYGGVEIKEEESSNPGTDGPAENPEPDPEYVIEFDQLTVEGIETRDGVELSFDSAEDAMMIECTVDGRPNFLIPFNAIPEVSEYPYVALRVKVDYKGSNGVFFMASGGSNYDIVSGGVYTNKDVRYTSENEWITVVLNYSSAMDGIEDGADGLYTGDSAYIRFDPWMNGQSGAVMYMDSIAFFRTQEGARAYVGLDEQVTPDPGTDTEPEPEPDPTPDPIEIVFNSADAITSMIGLDGLTAEYDAGANAAKLTATADGRRCFLIESTANVTGYKYMVLRVATNHGTNGCLFSATDAAGKDIVVDGMYLDKNFTTVGGDWENIIIDYSGNDPKDQFFTGSFGYIRFDPWFDAVSGDVMYINSVAFFATAEEAQAYAGNNCGTVSYEKPEPTPDPIEIVFNSADAITSMIGLDGLTAEYDAGANAAKLTATADGRRCFLIESTANVTGYKYMVLRVATNHGTNGCLFSATDAAGKDIVVDGMYLDKNFTTVGGDWENIIIDYSGNDPKDQFFTGSFGYIRFDPWFDAVSGDVMYINSVAFFATAEEAQAYAGNNCGTNPLA